MKNNIYIIVLFVLLVSVLSSCVEDVYEDIVTNGPIYPSEEVVNVSMYGTVTDNRDIPVVSAEVQIFNGLNGNLLVLTDENGYYEFLDVQVTGKTAKIGVRSREMFDLIYHSNVIKNKISETNFELAPIVKTGNFQAENGGMISEGNNFTLTFEPNSIIYDNGEVYKGSVEVFVNTIDPLDLSQNKRNYGGNVGENEILERYMLNTFQGLQVELKSPSGDLLNIKNESFVDVKIKIQDNLPSGFYNKELALLSYNKERGIWGKETTGQIKNGYYVASLPHFSSWVWALMNLEPVNIYGKINLLDQGEPYFGKTYILFEYDDIGLIHHPAHDGSFVAVYGLVDEEFKLVVKNECDEEIYSKKYPLVMNDTNLGVISIETAPNYTNELRVNVFNCDGSSVDVGYSRFCVNELNYNRCQVLPILDGTVKYDFLNCNSDMVGNLFLLNTNNLATIDPISINLSDQDVNIAAVSLCDTFLNHFSVNVNGSFLFKHWKVDYFGTSNSNGLSAADFDIEHSVSVQTDMPITSTGTYSLQSFKVRNADGSIFSDDRDNDVILEVEEFIGNASDPTNHYLVPERIKATFYGEVDHMDPITEEVIGTLLVNGSILID